MIGCTSLPLAVPATMASVDGAPAVWHLGAGTFLLRLKSCAPRTVAWLTVACGAGISRAIPVVVVAGSATNLLIWSRARTLSVARDSQSDATLSIIRVPEASRPLLRRFGWLKAKTGIGVGPDVFIQRIHRAAVPPGTPVEHVVLDTPRLSTLEAFGVSILKNGTIDHDLLGEWPRPSNAHHTPVERSAAAIGVVVHLHYRDLWPEIEWFVRNIPFTFRLHVSLTDPPQPDDRALRARIESLFDQAEIHWLPNRGRDIAPFLSLLRDGVLANYPILCKIHSKKSPDGSCEDLVGRLWRRRCMLDLLGSADRVREAVSLLAPGSKVGMVGPRALLHSRSNGISQSKEELNCGVMRRVLASRGFGDVPTEDFQFFAGTMFWVRRDALQLVEALNLMGQDFPAEPAPGNGSNSHAMERLLGVSVRYAGLKLVGLPETDASSALGRIHNA
jgi:hypothetical protein